MKFCILLYVYISKLTQAFDVIHLVNITKNIAQIGVSQQTAKAKHSGDNLFKKQTKKQKLKHTVHRRFSQRNIQIIPMQWESIQWV